MGHQFSDVSGLASGARALNLQYAAEIQDGYLAVTAFNDPDLLSLDKLALALDALVDAKATAAGILTDPRYTNATKVQEARTVVSKALAAAQDAAKTYGGLLDSTKAALSAKMLPKMPTSADSSIVAFRAGEITKALESAGGNVATTANGMLADALSQGDAVKAGILAGGLLNDTYVRLGTDMGLLQTLFAKTLAAAQGDSSSSGRGARLLALLSQGGSDTFYGFRDWLRSTLGSEQSNYDASVSSYVALSGGVQGDARLGPHVERRTVPQTVSPQQAFLRREAMQQRMTGE